MSEPTFNKKERLDEIYQLMFDYFINTLGQDEAKSVDVKAAHDFLNAHNYDFKLSDDEQASVNLEKAKEALEGIDDDEIRMIAREA